MRAPVSFFFLVSAFCLVGEAPAYGQIAAEQAKPRTVDIAAHVTEASQRFGLPESWIYAVMRTESAGRVGAISSAGAIGLMQLMPGTWARQRGRYGLGSDPFDPRDNILAGASYLREMHDSYGTTGMLAAYNAGPGRYEDWRDRGRLLPAETRAYVARIAPELQSAGAITAVTSTSPAQTMRLSWTQSQLFAARPDSTDAASGSSASAAPQKLVLRRNTNLDGLFAPVSGSGSQ